MSDIFFFCAWLMMYLIKMTLYNNNIRMTPMNLYLLLSHLRMRLHLLVTWISLRLGHISFPYHHHELYYIYIGGTSITTLLSSRGTRGITYIQFYILPACLVAMLESIRVHLPRKVVYIKKVKYRLVGTWNLFNRPAGCFPSLLNNLVIHSIGYTKWDSILPTKLWLWGTYS